MTKFSPNIFLENESSYNNLFWSKTGIQTFFSTYIRGAKFLQQGTECIMLCQTVAIGICWKYSKAFSALQSLHSLGLDMKYLIADSHSSFFMCSLDISML